MNYREKDFRGEARDHVEAIVAGMPELRRQIGSDPAANPAVDRLLLWMLLHSRRLMDYVAPLQSSGEIFGLPKEFTSGADRPEPVVYRESKPSWDFSPW